MAEHRARKRFGQNFLISDSVISRIIEAIGPSESDTIIEVGPGCGALTGPLAESGARVLAVEFDRDLIARLKRLLGPYENVTVVNQDFLTFRPEDHGLKVFKLIGNLPYNITSPVLQWAVDHADYVVSACFMMQREVAARLCSDPGSKDWSPLAIFTQLAFETEKRFDVKPSSFRPQPRVTSTVVTLTPRRETVTEIPSGFERVVRTSFGQRRKQLVNNLVPELAGDAEEARAVLERAGLAADARAEQLSVDDFFRLTREIESSRLNSSSADS